MNSQMQLTGNGLKIADVFDIAVNDTEIQIPKNILRAVDSAHRRIQEWGRREIPIYGVNTGFGEMVSVVVPSKHMRALQENLVRSHAAGAGELFPDIVVRAMMVARGQCLVKGHSGVSCDSILLLKEFIKSRRQRRMMRPCFRLMVDACVTSASVRFVSLMTFVVEDGVEFVTALLNLLGAAMGLFVLVLALFKKNKHHARLLKKIHFQPGLQKKLFA